MENTSNYAKNLKIMSIFFAIFVALFCFVLVPLEFQNDTFYTIKIGEKIAADGIDMKDPFSWHENLDYTYPHWLFDLSVYKIFNLGGFKGLYISTCLLSSILGLTIFFCNKKITNNALVSFITTLTTMFLIRGFLAARAQLVTFILFTLEYFLIERFVEKKKLIHVILLFIISVLISNIHIAVWPFFFILFLPQVGAQLWIWISNKMFIDNSLVKAYERDIKKEEKRDPNSPKIAYLKEQLEKQINERNIRKKACEEKEQTAYKIVPIKNKNALLLIPVMILCAFAGLLTPLGPNATYTYLIRTVMGDTTHYISEHLPLVLIQRPALIVYIVILTWLLLFKKNRINLPDFFLLLGLAFLTVLSGRQESMLILLGSYVLAKLIKDFLIPTEENYAKIVEVINKKKISYLYIFIFLTFMAMPTMADNLEHKFINEELYPVSATNYIKENLDVDNIKLFNEYDYGSYLLFNDIPVFIDSRADLYAPEFNSECTVFDDFMKLMKVKEYPETIFEKYGITHMILINDGVINTIVSGSQDYNVLYSDDYFTVYERI